MELAAVRILTDDIERMIDFYERVTGVKAIRRHVLFAEIRTPRATVAIASSQTIPLLGVPDIEVGTNRSIILDIEVDNVDHEYLRLQSVVASLDRTPTNMPWGNRSLLFHDPDGNVVNLYTLVQSGHQNR